MLGCFGPSRRQCKSMGASNTKEAFRTAVLDLVNNQQVWEREGKALASAACEFRKCGWLHIYGCGLNPIPVSGSRTGVVGLRKTYSPLPHYPSPLEWIIDIFDGTQTVLLPSLSSPPLSFSCIPYQTPPPSLSLRRTTHSGSATGQTPLSQPTTTLPSFRPLTSAT